MRKARKFLSVFVTMLMIVSLLPTQAVHGFENLFTGRERSPHMVGDVAFGDVGGHGVVNDASISLLARYLLSTTPDAFLAANINFNKRNASFKGDGVITTTDLTMLRAYIDGAIDYLGHIPGSLTIMPIDHRGEAVHEAEIEITINGESTTHQTTTGVISQQRVPEGSTVSFSITSEAGTYEAEIESFCPDEHGVQLVTVGFDEPIMKLISFEQYGSVYANRFEIKYTAIPSRGAEIEQVYYTVNGRFFDNIYIPEARWTLGEAIVNFPPDVTTIEFTVLDTLGKTTSYDMEWQPNPDTHSFSALNQPSEFWETIPGCESSSRFMTDRITLDTVWIDGQGNPIRVSQVEEAIQLIDGTIIGQSPLTGSFTIQVQVNSYDGLVALGEEMLEAYPDLFESFWIENLPSAILPAIIQPAFESFAAPCIPRRFWEPIPECGQGHNFVTNRIVLLANSSDAHGNKISLSQIEEAIKLIDGVIIGQNSWGYEFAIQIPVNSYDGITALGEKMIEEYPDLFRNFYIQRTGMFVDGGSVETGGICDDPWYTEIGQEIMEVAGSLPSFRQNSVYHQWIFDDIGIYNAWNIVPQTPSTVRIGIVDNGIRHNHGDLQIPEANVFSRGSSGWHGSPVMGIIGATHVTTALRALLT
jgi:hypothetical protein